MNSYELSRKFWDWCYENPEKIKPNHSALYFFIIEHCNRLGWKKKFGLPTTMAKEAIGIKSYNTYINTLNDLVAWGFVEMIEVSKNQYSSNIVALSNFNKALDKALDKALIKHTTKQSESTRQSIDSIDKQLEQRTNKQFKQETNKVIFPFNTEKFKEQWQFWKDYKKDEFSFKYKTIQSEQAALKKLARISKNNEAIAIEIIHQSFENSWKGLFELKNDNNGKKKNSEDRARVDEYLRFNDPDYKNY